MASDIISANYEALRQVARQFSDQQKRVQQLQRGLVDTVDRLRRGGWIADSATLFYREMDQQVFISILHLMNALAHSQAATLEIITILQRAEAEASGALRGEAGTGGGATGGGQGISGAIGSLPNAFNQQSWFTLNDDRDGGWNGARPEVAGAIVVNGIQNDVNDLRDLMQGASDELGGVPVLGVFNATGGKDTMGFVRDLGQSIADKFQVKYGFRPAPDNAAVSSLVEAIKATNGQTPIIAHSQGGAITAAALHQLTREGYDLSNMKVITMGSAEFNFPTGPNAPQYEHRVHVNDVVPMLAGGRLDYYSFDPLTLKKHILTGEIKLNPDFKITDPLAPHSAANYFKNF